MQNAIVKQTQSDLSTSQASERWAIRVDKKVFYINGNQKENIKQLMENGSRAIIWFNDFAISIPHIQYIYRDFDEERSGFSRSGGNAETISMTLAERKKSLLALEKARGDLTKRGIIK